MSRPLNFRQLEALRAVILTGSFTMAARHLHVTQPAISNLIRDLEQDLNLQLFERLGTSVKPTPQAEILFREFQKVHSGLDRLRDVAATVQPGPAEVIRLGALPIYADTVAPGYISKARERSDAIQFLLDSMRHDELISALLADEIDCAITSVPVNLGTIVEHFQIAEPAIVIAPHNSKFANRHSISLSEMKREPLILFPPSCPFRRALDQFFADQMFHPQQDILVRAPSAACRLVHEGQGIAIVQASAKRVYQGNFHTLTLVEPFAWQYGLVSKKTQSTPDHVNRFIRQVTPAQEQTRKPVRELRSV